MIKTNKRMGISFTVLFYIVAVSGILVAVNACNKGRHDCEGMNNNVSAAAAAKTAATPLQQGLEQSKVATIMAITPSPDAAATWVIFRELAEQFSVTDATVLASLKDAFAANRSVRINFDPWKGLVTKATQATEAERSAAGARQLTTGSVLSRTVDLATTDPDVINNIEGTAVLNTSSAATTGLTDVIPDVATAQMMFDYIAHQCCQLAGPYGVDYCITFQYCEDGCYARAHKMCYVLNNKFHYATHKIFSFAYPGAYTLSVKAEKWGGCCINWWYHVAPLVNVKTPSGTKAYVFDPAMFDQPVLLATWLHAQQNPACAGSHTPKVTSYNIQPTTSYAPNDTATFITDPMYVDTDNTLTSYHSLISCP